MEIILLQQALRRGGLNEPINFVVRPLSYLRRIRLVKDGSFALWANTAWLNEAQPLEQDVYISKPVIERGEYIVGLYVHPSNTKALAARTLSDIQGLRPPLIKVGVLTGIRCLHWVFLKSTAVQTGMVMLVFWLVVMPISPCHPFSRARGVSSFISGAPVTAAMFAMLLPWCQSQVCKFIWMIVGTGS